MIWILFFHLSVKLSNGLCFIPLQCRNIDLLRVEGLSFNKGRCFVEFANKADALKAVEALSGKVELKGKFIQARCGMTGATSDLVNEKLAKQQEQLKEEESSREKDFSSSSSSRKSSSDEQIDTTKKCY